MALSRVAHSVSEMIVSAADRAGVPLVELCEALPVDAQQLRRRSGGLEWDVFISLLDGLERRLGYPHLEAICAHIPDVTPDSRRLLSAFVSPRLLLRFVCRLMGPSMYPMLHSTFEEVERDDGVTLHVVMRLRDGFKASETFFRLQQPSLASVPCFIGLPPVPCHASTTALGGEYRLELPRTEGLLARVGRGGRGGEHEALREMEEDKARLLEANELLWRRRDTAFRGKLAEAATRWSLTDRQVQVLSGLARGLSNKALTKDLGCSVKTVETHVTAVLRRAGADSRLSLVAMFWRDL